MATTPPVVYPTPADMQVATMTLICKIGASIDMKKVVASTVESPGGIETIKYGNSKKEEKSSSAAATAATAATATARKNKSKKPKKHFYNQVTLIVKPYPERQNGINMKLSENGSLQLTGPKNIEEGHAVIRRMVELLYQFDPSIFYKKTKIVPEGQEDDMHSTVTIDTTTSEAEGLYNVEYFTPAQIAGLPIISTKCELIIVSFQIPFLVQLSKFNAILTDKYNLLSIFGTSTYPGVNTKMTYTLNCTEQTHVKKKKRFLCQCRDMSIFTFRTGRIIITGFENLEKIAYIFEKYMAIVKAEEAHIKVSNSSSSVPFHTLGKSPALTDHNIMKVTVTGPKRRHFKLFEIVETF
jgi:hypothetical protein